MQPMLLLHCFAQLLKPILILNFFWLLIRPTIVLQGNSLRAVSVSITLGSTFRITLKNWTGKFINCKLLVTSSVHELYIWQDLDLHWKRLHESRDWFSSCWMRHQWLKRKVTQVIAWKHALGCKKTLNNPSLLTFQGKRSYYWRVLVLDSLWWLTKPSEYK